MYGRIRIMCRLHISNSWVVGRFGVAWKVTSEDSVKVVAPQIGRPSEDVPNETSVGHPVIWETYIGVVDGCSSP
jgi:hypothetical protein